MRHSPRIHSTPAHLLGLQAIVDIVAAGLLIQPLANWCGVAGAALAVPAGFAISLRLAARGARGLAAGALVALAAIFGSLVAEPLLAGNRLPLWLMGTSRVLGLVEFFTFGLLTLAAVVTLRGLASLHRTFLLLEMLVVVMSVTSRFAGHRDLQLDRPRFLTDWALSQGMHPQLPLLIVGVVLTIGLVMLMLPRQQAWRNLAAVALLATLGAVFFQTLAGQSSAIQRNLFAAPPQGNEPPQSSPPNDPPPGNSPPPQDPSQSPPPPRDTPRQDPPNIPNFGPPPKQDPPTPLAVVTLHDDFQPTEQQFYLRTTAYSRLQTNLLLPTEDPALDVDVPTGPLAAPLALPGQVPMAAAVAANMFRDVETTVTLTARIDAPLSLSNATQIEPQTNPNPQMFQQAYRVKSHVLVSPLTDIRLLGCQGGSATWPKGAMDHYLRVPNDPRYRKLAAEIVSQSIDSAQLKPEFRGSAMLRTLAVRRWMEENVTYTKTSVKSTADPVADFLFESRQGYCTYIAHSMAFLLRSLDIPARVAGGYRVDSRRAGQGSTLLVQSTDAHAWCEIYLDGVGWVVIDAAPQKTLDPPPPEPSPNLQQQMGEQARPNPPSGQSNDRHPNDQHNQNQDDNDDHHSLDWEYVWRTVAALLFVSLVYSVKLYRRLAPRFGSPARRYCSTYRAVLDRLAEIGMARQFGETREEFAQRVARLVPGFQVLTERHLERALTGRDRLEADSWLTLEREFVRQLTLVSPKFRRRLGLLNPISWAVVR